MNKMKYENNNEKRGNLSIYALSMAGVLQERWRKEIEEAINKARIGITTNKRTKLDNWFRRRWYRDAAIMRKRKGPKVEYE